MSRPRTVNKHLPKYVTEIHGAYWYRPPGGKAERICSKDDYVALYKFMAEVSARGIQPSQPLTTLSACFDRYESEVVPALAPRTQKDYRRILSILRRVFGHLAPDDVQPRDIGRFLDVSKGRIQKNRQVSVLSAVYTKMVGRWYCATRNPCRDVERNPAKKRTRYVTDLEYAAVYALMPPRVQIAMELALRTYQRQGDLLSLKWEQVTPEGVLFRQGKTGKRLRVKIGPKLEAVLERAKRLTPQLPRKYVLKTRGGRRYTSEGFRAVWQRHMKKALKGYVKKGKRYEPVLTERFTFHDLRAKAISDTKDIQKAFEGAGHTSMAMTRGVYDRGIRDVDDHE